MDLFLCKGMRTNFFLFRWKPMSYMNPRDTWALALGLGNMDDDNYVLGDGIFLSVYETGPWAGIKLRDNNNIGWLGANNLYYDMMVILNILPASLDE